MRSDASAIALRVGEALLVGCALTSLGGCVQPSVIAAAAVIEIPTTDSTRENGSVPARDVIGEVRLGHGLDVDGKVPPSFGASRFTAGDPIHLSMWETTDASAGSAVRVSVLDSTDRIVWSEEKQAPHGGSYVSFGIGRGLARGTYRADVIVAHEVTSRTAFEVLDRKDR